MWARVCVCVCVRVDDHYLRPLPDEGVEQLGVVVVEGDGGLVTKTKRGWIFSFEKIRFLLTSVFAKMF